MEILEGLNGLRQLPPGAVMSIGNYDGLHRGHAEILHVGRELRQQETGRKLAVVTFEPHPLTVLKPEIAPPRLTSPAMKERLLCGAEVDYLVVLPPEPAVLNLTAEDFWKILRDEAKVSWLVEGSEFNFGKGRGGNIQRLQEWTKSSPVQLRVVEPVKVALLDLSVVQVSSSLIRWLVAYGRMRDAAICLGRPYTLEGEVIKGYQRGQTIGVPTANLKADQQLVPADGVYAGRCRICSKTYAAAVSIGTMPTFGENRRQIEAHLVGFSGDLYGQVVRLEMVDWLRDQRKYNGVELLKEQLQKDIEQAVERVDMDPAREVATV
jgi:riboflavin kinase/FMN adenylyltransferase